MNDRAVYEKLAGLVSRPEWDNYLVWITNKHADAHRRLEDCQPEFLKGIQAEIRLLKEMMDLRKVVSNIMNEK